MQGCGRRRYNCWTVPGLFLSQHPTPGKRSTRAEEHRLGGHARRWCPNGFPKFQPLVVPIGQQTVVSCHGSPTAPWVLLGGHQPQYASATGGRSACPALTFDAGLAWSRKVREKIWKTARKQLVSFTQQAFSSDFSNTSFAGRFASTSPPFHHADSPGSSLQTVKSPVRSGVR